MRQWTSRRVLLAWKVIQTVTSHWTKEVGLLDVNYSRCLNPWQLIETGIVFEEVQLEKAIRFSFQWSYWSLLIAFVSHISIYRGMNLGQVAASVLTDLPACLLGWSDSIHHQHLTCCASFTICKRIELFRAYQTFEWISHLCLQKSKHLTPSRLDFVCPNHTRLRTERCLPRWCIRILLFQASYVCVEWLDQGQGP